MFMPAVKGAVHKLHLRDFLLKKMPVLFSPAPHPGTAVSFPPRKDSSAPERTSSARFIIDDAVPEIFNGSVAERNPV